VDDELALQPRRGAPSDGDRVPLDHEVQLLRPAAEEDVANRASDDIDARLVAHRGQHELGARGRLESLQHQRRTGMPAAAIASLTSGMR
jgi:hypothetical protein